MNSFNPVKWMASLFLLMTIFFSIPASAEITAACMRDPACVQQQTQAQSASNPHGVGTAAVKNLLGKNIAMPNAGIFVSLIQNVMKDGDTMANRYIPIANGTTAILGAIAFVWLGIMIMLSQADIWHMGLRPLFTLIFTIGFAFFMLEDYDNLTSAVVTGFTYAGGVLIGSNGNQEAFIKLFYGFGANFITMIKEMISVLAISPDAGFFSDAIKFINDIWNVALDMFVIVISSAIFMLLMVIFIVVYLGYQIVAGIAIAVGPVFIPFLVLPITRPLFDGWLKMLIMSGIYLMTSTVIVGLMETAMSSYFASTTSSVGPSMVSAAGSDMINLVVVLELIILEVVAVFALLKTHEFAHAIAGNVSIGGMNGANAVVSIAKKAAG